MHPNTAKALIWLFYHTFGLPRAIELMIRTAGPTIARLEEVYQNAVIPSKWGMDLFLQKAQARLEFGETVCKFHQALQIHYPETLMADKLQSLLAQASSDEKQRITKAIQLLDIKAVFCLCQKINEPIPHLGITPKELEESAYLVQWQKISETKKCYTRPFLMDYEDLDKPLPLLKYQTDASSRWVPFDISLSTLILHSNVASFLYDRSTGGTSFAHVAGASLYARYVLTKESLAGRRKDIKLEDILGSCVIHLPDAIKKATVEWNGVVMLNQSIDSTSQETFNEIHAKQVIAISGESSFADIIVPVIIQGEPAFIGIQTKPRRGQVVTNRLKLPVLTS